MQGRSVANQTFAEVCTGRSSVALLQDLCKVNCKLATDSRMTVVMLPSSIVCQMATHLILRLQRLNKGLLVVRLNARHHLDVQRSRALAFCRQCIKLCSCQALRVCIAIGC